MTSEVMIFKALLYEHMVKGSLEDWLHPQVISEGVCRKLSLRHWLSIAVDIASTVEYLHHDCDVPVIHCDLKPSNVLLDAEMTAKVSDFGLTRILSADDVVVQVSSTGVRGTVGYSPPGA
ncbi:hypothetical protein MLD38_037227 [Melastoma candidum]|uniref:Uncharacterized protein n=1 Tax=Melastoma candidum TaxID=119954 RepID=A0ACB9LNC2_9MYRT|nr:hypothetical protein MLD38_037227 [Melastoma candidum]